jgi:hypothetical protein
MSVLIVRVPSWNFSMSSGTGPAQAALRTAITRIRRELSHAPLRTPPLTVCTSGRVVLLAPVILSRRKDHSPGHTSSLRYGRSTLTLIFHGKSGAPVQARDVQHATRRLGCRSSARSRTSTRLASDIRVGRPPAGVERPAPDCCRPCHDCT